MVTAAVIENGKVVNVVQTSPAVARERGWIVSGEARKGDSYDGQRFIPEPKPEPKEPPKSREQLAVDALIRRGILTAEDLK